MKTHSWKGWLLVFAVFVLLHVASQNMPRDRELFEGGASRIESPDVGWWWYAGLTVTVILIVLLPTHLAFFFAGRAEVIDSDGKRMPMSRSEKRHGWCLAVGTAASVACFAALILAWPRDNQEHQRTQNVVAGAQGQRCPPDVSAACLKSAGRLLRNGHGAGSAVLIDHRGNEAWILTAQHCVNDPVPVTVEFFDGEKRIVLPTAEIFAVDEKHDLAILRIVTDQVLPRPLPIASKCEAMPFPVYSFGFPGGKATPCEFVANVVDVKDHYFVTDKTVERGRSGSAIVDHYGCVVGIASRSNFTTSGFFTDAQHIRDFLQAASSRLVRENSHEGLTITSRQNVRFHIHVR